MPNDQNSLYMFTYRSYALQHIIIMNTLSWAHDQAQDTMHQFLYSSTSAVSIFHSFADSGWRYCSALCLGVAVQLYCLGVAVQLCCLGVAAQLCCLGVAALLCCLGVAALLCTLLSWEGWQNCSALRCPGVSTISMLQAAHEQQMIKESALTRVRPKARGKTPGASSANDSQGQPLLWVGDETDVAPVLCLFHVGWQL